MKTCGCENKSSEELIHEVIPHVPNQKKIEDVSFLFKALSDPTRIRILLVLKNHELCVCDISRSLEMSQSAISHQLKILRDHDLVRTRRAGKSIFYALADEHIHTMFSQAFDHVSEERTP
jgi:ArsR family transcriptional regulator, lead/cadmium/zinc/bismuth-responsive transcriptional repressor